MFWIVLYIEYTHVHGDFFWRMAQTGHYMGLVSYMATIHIIAYESCDGSVEKTCQWGDLEGMRAEMNLSILRWKKEEEGRKNESSKSNI